MLFYIFTQLEYPSYVRLVLILVIIIVPTSQSEVIVMQSHNNQPRQDDERSPVDDNCGMCVHKCC